VKSKKTAFALLTDTKEESDISDSEQSEGDEEGESHFLHHDSPGFQFAQVETELESRIAAWPKTGRIAKEERDVAAIDIPSAFIQTRVEDERGVEIIKIRGTLVDILIDIAPDVY
jgi:hypothetical protein